MTLSIRPRKSTPGILLCVALLPPCGGQPVLHHGGAADAVAFKRAQQKEVLTFLGYSGAGYEDVTAMLRHAADVLDAADPARTIVNIGATIDGVGAVYELAKNKGFTTIGIVSTQARDTKTPLSPCVDHVFFVKDPAWGGYVDGTETLSPTSAALVEITDRIVAIGGGDVARAELLAARRMGKPWRFIAADMNHAIAIEKARQRGLPPPTDFSGAVAAAAR